MNNLIIIALTLLFSAFFSGMEIAFVSANRLRIELDKKQNRFSASIISYFTNHSGYFISTMLVGNNIALVIYGIGMSNLLEPFILNSITNEYFVLIIKTVVSTLLILFTAEFLPKALFRIDPNAALSIFALPAFIMYCLLYPITRFSVSLSNFFIKYIFKLETGKNETQRVFGKIDLGSLMQEPSEFEHDKTEEEHEIKIFRNALDFSKVKLRDCMVPRADIIAVDEETEVEELTQRFIETGFSKIPVYRQSIDTITGYVSSKDLFKHPQSVRSKIIRMPIVPETMNASRLLHTLMQEHKSMALVVDEFGGTSGIVSIEDIIEQIFGDIEDEHDTEEWVEKQLNETEFIFAGRHEIDYLNETYGLHLPESEEYDTLAGFIFWHIGRVPKQRENFSYQKYLFTFLKVTGTRLDVIRLRILDQE